MQITTSRAVDLSRWINIAALFALLAVLSGSMDLQFGMGEPPCPLCLIQRSGMIGLAVGPIMNLLWGIRPAHYAVSILAALVGAAGSTRQILLHINDPIGTGYGPAVLGLHLYTWALVTFVIAIAGCALLLLWSTPFAAGDTGLGPRSPMRALAYMAIAWVTIDAAIIGISVLPECGLGMCPDDPTSEYALGDLGGVLFIGTLALVSLVIGFLLNRSRPSR